MKRKTYQFGWLETKVRTDGSRIWVYRYRERNLKGGYVKRSVEVGNMREYPTEALALKQTEHLRLLANPENANGRIVTFGALADRYLAEELPELRHSTGDSYKSYIENYVKPKWGEYPIYRVKPFPVEQWLKALDLAPKTRGHIHNLMRVLINSAMRWELIELGENPMKLVRVRGISKRQNEPRVLSLDECHRLLAQLDEEPFRTMVVLDMATGLRCSELVALQWCDFQWQTLSLLVRRAIVDGVVDEVKTKYSRVGLPLDPALAEILWTWKGKSVFNRDSDWVFASPHRNGEWPYSGWGVQQRRIAPAGRRAELGSGIGWHTFRHTFSCLLRANGEDIKVQQELLRHADIRTTLNVYTQAMSDQKRQAHSKIVRSVLAKQRELGTPELISAPLTSQ
jgi:integrase